MTTEAPAVHDCFATGVTGVGDPHADVMFVGIAPGRDEWKRSRKPFTGQSGRLLDALLKYIDVGREEVYTTNLVCWWEDHPTQEDINACWPRFAEEVNLVKPKLIVCLGTIVTQALLPDAGSFGKAQGGIWLAKVAGHECWALSTYHPAAYLHHGSDFKVEINDGVRDFKKIPYVLDWAEGARPDLVDYKVMSSLEEANAMLQHFSDNHEARDFVACDVETLYDGSEMLSIAFSCGHGTFHVPKALMSRPEWSLLRSAPVRWTFHNGMFDTRMIRKLLHVDLPIVEDTMLMSYSLDERGGGAEEADSTGTNRAVGIHGLKRLAREYFAAGHYDAVAHGRIDQLEPNELAYYNSCDAAYTYRLAHLFYGMQLVDNVREMYATLLIPIANVLTELHEHGIYIDKGEWTALAKEWLPAWLKWEEDLQAEALTLGWDGEDDINLNSPKQLSHLIYDICKHTEVGKAKTSTAMAVLKIIQEEGTPLAAFCRGMLEWRGLDHDITNYLQTITPGWVHPEPLIHGSRVGRMAYHAPPVQTIPKPRTVGAQRARIRRIFHAPPPDEIAPEGYDLIEFDYRQAELWAATMVTGDEQMLEDLNSGDFHARVAESSFRVTKAELEQTVEGALRWELLRDSSKILVYGKFYGAGIDALMGDKAIQGRGSTGSYVLFKTRADAEAHIRSFDLRYAKYTAWREEEKRKVQREGEQQSATGRKRRYYLVQDYKQLNQAINMPISSLSHDHIFASMAEAHPLLKEFGAWMWYEIHDSIMVQSPKRFRQEIIALMVRVMEKPKFGFSFGIPVDVKIGDNWMDLHKP